MSYNGIGLTTARGSGTNGYVQRNLSDLHKGKKGESEGNHFFQRELRNKRNEKREARARAMNNNQFDEGILNHERKRELEVKIMEYRDKLEDQDELDDEAIDEKVSIYRNQLLSGKMNYRDSRVSNSHEDRERYGTKKSKKVQSNIDLISNEEIVSSKQKAYNEKVNPFISDETKIKTETEIEVNEPIPPNDNSIEVVTSVSKVNRALSSNKNRKVKEFTSDMY